MLYVYCKRLMYCIQLPNHSIPPFSNPFQNVRCMAHYHPRMVFAQPTIQPARSPVTAHTAFIYLFSTIGYTFGEPFPEIHTPGFAQQTAPPFPLSLKKAPYYQNLCTGGCFVAPASTAPKCLTQPGRQKENSLFVKQQHNVKKNRRATPQWRYVFYPK